MNNPQEQLIRLGLAGMDGLQISPAERIALLRAAADLLPMESDLAHKCEATAHCIKEAEDAQLRLFKFVRS